MFMSEKKMLKITWLLVAAGAFILMPSKADAVDMAVGLKGGTLGAGVEATLDLTSGLNFRVGANAFSYGATTYKSGNPVEYDLKLLSFPLLLDWFPLGDDSGFRISSGVIINKNKFTANAEPVESYEIDGVDYPADLVGDLSGDVGFNTFVPYAGIGWGNPLTTDSRFSVSFDLGIAFQGDPTVSLTANGPIASDAEFQEALLRETDDIKDEIDSFKYYPVISLGVAYRF